MKLIIMLCFIFSSVSLFSKEEAEDYYYKGEQAKTVVERKEAFNQALKLYSDREERDPSSFANGNLYYNMGNTYFQLNEYGWAVYYYYRALKLQPRNEKITRNLNITLSKLGLPEYKENGVFYNLLFFQHYLSLSEQIKILFLFSLIIITIVSLYLWGVIHSMKALLILPVICWFILIITIGYSLYFSPLEGVMVENSTLYRDAGEHFAKASEAPVREGSKLKVLDVVLNGSWLKVLTPQGTVGYIPNKAIRLIDM